MSARSTAERAKVKKKMSKAQVQLALIKKKQCDATALLIVEKLLEPIVDAQWLLKNLKHISRSHMEDVIEERAIVKLCGYVLCKNPITVVYKQQYHISTKNNKVYDISRRKNFCCSGCYGAFNYLLEQMLTSPLWLRDKEEIPDFKLLPLDEKSSKGIPGDEVIVNDLQFHKEKENDTKIADGTSSHKHHETIGNVSHNNLVPNIGINESKTEQVQKLFNKQHVTVKNVHHEMSDKIEFTEGHNETEIAELTEGNEVVEHKSVKALNKKTISQEDKETCISSEENANGQLQTSTEFTNQPSKQLEAFKEVQPVDKVMLSENRYSMDDSNKCQIVDKNIEETLPPNKTECAAQQKKNVHEVKLDVDSMENMSLNDEQTKNCGNVEEVEVQKRQADVRCKKDLHKKSGESTKTTSSFYSLAMRVEQSVKEWVTEKTLHLLQGEPEAKKQLLETITQYDRYIQLCKKLNKIQLEEEKQDRTEFAKDSLKPLPHYCALQEAGKEMQLKVSAFYKGSTVVELPANDENGTSKDEESTVLPLTDAHDAKALRRRIFLDKLDKILPDLMRTLSGNIKSYPAVNCSYDNDRSMMIKVLISTFSLSATNIVFKTAEWTLVGLIIMKMLSVVDCRVKALLATKQASMYISMILMSYKLDENYLDRLIIEVTNNPKIFCIDVNR